MNQILLTGKRSFLKSLFLMSLLLLAGTAYAQQRTVTGVVKDNDTGEAVPGVNVVIKGSSTGTITDTDGAFSLQVSSDDDVLVFSFIGYLKEEVPVGTRSVVSLNLKADITSLEEVVVIGYGEQKKSVVTGAISGVKGKELENMPIMRVEQALQGRVSGVTMASSSGQPGSAATIRIRGITTLNDNTPLWIVDGVVVDNGGIGYLNSSDIESIEVLKDAASQAIYGTRAATGVIIVTTKKGKSGKLSVSYNGYLGTSAPARKLDLLNASEYATLRNEAAIAGGKPIPFADPASLGKGTDWQAEIFNNSARRQSHELSLSGGNEKSNFYTSFGYFDQEGIVATDISRYTRTNMRLNSTHKISKYVTFGQNLGYAYTKSTGLGNTNSEFGGPLSSAINLDPITPVVETDPTRANAAPYTASPFVLRDGNGNPYGISSLVGQEMTNPAAYIQTRLGGFGWANDFVGNAYLEVEPIKGLKVRTTLGGKLAFWGSEGFSPAYYLNASSNSTQNSFNRGQNRVFNWNVENTITYSRTIGKHNGSILLGQGAYEDGESVGTGVTYYNLRSNNYQDAQMNESVAAANRVGSGYDNLAHRVSSLFTRLTYDYDEKYLLTAIMRRDGSTRFGSDYKYGYFPSFSAGWVASRETFWPANNYVSFFKVRGGYGVVGNDNIGDLAYLPTVGGGRNYVISNDNVVIIGMSPNAPENTALRWEETSQLNIGFETTILNDISLTFDWYKKRTTGILRNPPIPGYIGAIGNPAANAGTVDNTGVEIELGYKKQLGDLTLGINGNVSFIKNEVVSVGRGLIYENGVGFQTMGSVTRIQVGEAWNRYYGYKTLGIFQTQEDVDSYVNAEGNMILPNAKPGDFIWADLDGNGSIGETDRTFLGNPIPDVSYGLTVTANYKGIDLTIFGQGVAGNQIFQGLRRLDIANANWQSGALSRWTGPGTSNEYPRIVADDPNKNFNYMSDFYLEDGDYFRLKTVQVGYTIPRSLLSKIGVDRVRVYVMSENLLTFTKYTGYDPEIGGNVMSIDRGIYPQARSFMVGLNVGL